MQALSNERLPSMIWDVPPSLGTDWEPEFCRFKEGEEITTIAAIANPYAGRGRTKKFAERFTSQVQALGMAMELHWTLIRTSASRITI